jgi:taurine dioxygenase
MSEFEIKPMPVGAEVAGFTPGAEEDPAVRAQLYAAWLEHGILLFHGVDSIPKHLAMSSVFGEPELHPLPNMRDPEEPLFMRLGDDNGPAVVYDNSELRRGRIAWHRDTAYTKGIAKGAMLRLRAVPPENGETLFADTAKAYDDLPQDVKDQIEHLEYKSSFLMQFRDGTWPGALWQTQRLASTEEYPANEQLATGSHEEMAKNLPPVVHPVVTHHPESGRKCIFISPKDTESILGLPSDESDRLIAYLVTHMTQPQYTYTHHWTVDDAIVWDNRRMLHAAAGYRIDHHRHGQRTTLTGKFNAGRDFVPATDNAPTPIPA